MPKISSHNIHVTNENGENGHMGETWGLSIHCMGGGVMVAGVAWVGGL